MSCDSGNKTYAERMQFILRTHSNFGAPTAYANGDFNESAGFVKWVDLRNSLSLAKGEISRSYLIKDHQQPLTTSDKHKPNLDTVGEGFLSEGLCHVVGLVRLAFNLIADAHGSENTHQPDFLTYTSLSNLQRSRCFCPH